jgi:hypothetical protein
VAHVHRRMGKKLLEGRWLLVVGPTTSSVLALAGVEGSLGFTAR